MGCLAMVVLFASMKEMWKLINIWLSYGQQKGDTDIWLNVKITYDFWKSVNIWQSYSQQKGDILTALKITYNR